MDKENKLNAEELDEVTGGDHIRGKDLSQYLGKIVRFSYTCNNTVVGHVRIQSIISKPGFLYDENYVYVRPADYETYLNLCEMCSSHPHLVKLPFGGRMNVGPEEFNMENLEFTFVIDYSGDVMTWFDNE